MRVLSTAYKSSKFDLSPTTDNSTILSVLFAMLLPSHPHGGLTFDKLFGTLLSQQTVYNSY